MENALLKKLRMFGSTRTVLTNNSQIWNDSVPFKTNVDTFIGYLLKIDEKDHDQKSTKSFTKEKKQVFDKMIDAALMVSSGVTAYAADINDNKLEEAFDYTKYTLKFGNEKEVYKRCQLIGEEADKIAVKIAPYNVTAAQIKKLNDLVKEFLKVIDTPRDVRTAGKSAKEEMIALFDECDHILDKIIDKLMQTYKESHPEFFLEYNNARFIGGWKKKKANNIEKTV